MIDSFFGPDNSVALHYRILSILILIFFVIAFWYMQMIPPGEGIDELGHFDYVYFIAKELRLPRQDLASDAPPDVIMIHHPPLYYLLGATLILPIDIVDRATSLRFNPHFVWSQSGSGGWRVILPNSQSVAESGTLLAFYILRGFSILLGIISLVMIYRSAQYLLPDQNWFPLAVTAVSCFNPAFIYMAAIVHHDALITLLYSACILWSLKYIKHPLSFASLVAGSVLLAAISLTKLSGVVLIPVLLLMIWTRPSRDQDWHGRFSQAILIIVVVCVCSGWWFIRNYVLYGDFSGQALWIKNFSGTLRLSPLTWEIFRHEFTVHLERTLWGAFGYMHILFPQPVRTIVWKFVGIALSGWLLILWRGLRGPLPSYRSGLTWAMVGLSLVLVLLFLTRLAFFTSAAWEGRYLLPASTAIGAALVVGINGFTNWKYQPVIGIALTLLIVSFAVIMPAQHIWPKYHLFAPAKPDEVERATPLHITFQKGVVLVAAHSSHSILIPGQALDIVTYWAADPQGSTFADPFVQMILVTEDGHAVASSTFWPDVNTLPEIWGERIIENRQSFYISPQQLPGKLSIQVTVRDGRKGPPLMVEHAQTSALEQSNVSLFGLVALGTVIELDPSAAPSLQHEELWANSIQLWAVSLPESVEISVSNLLPVTLYWYVQKTTSRDYTVFVHVLDQNGNLVAQLDQPPGGGKSPTSSWAQGKYLQDSYPVLLPTDLSPGEYRVRIGMYTWPELQRQTVMFQGEPVGDSIEIGRFSVADTKK